MTKVKTDADGNTEITLNNEQTLKLIYALGTAEDPELQALRETLFDKVGIAAYNGWIDNYEKNLY